MSSHFANVGPYAANMPAAIGPAANPAYPTCAKPVHTANAPYAAAPAYWPFTSTAIILVLFILLVIIGRAQFAKC